VKPTMKIKKPFPHVNAKKRKKVTYKKKLWKVIQLEET
jgi:hypothetical protein